MSILSQVQASGAPIGARIVIAGPEKVGKTTVSCGAPEPLLVPMEPGFAGVQVNHTPLLTDWGQMTTLQMEIVKALQANAFRPRTLIFDTGTALERLIHQYVIASDPAYAKNKQLNMETAQGGYGKAYASADRIYSDWLGWCDWLAINYRINIVLTCHVFASKIKDPLAGEYDSWDLQLHSPKDQRKYGKREITAQWADIIGFLHEPVVVTNTNNTMQAVSRGQGRVLAVERSPSYVAGNRYGMRGVINLAAPPANGWNNLAHSVWEATQGRLDLFNRERP